MRRSTKSVLKELNLPREECRAIRREARRRARRAEFLWHQYALYWLIVALLALVTWVTAFVGVGFVIDPLPSAIPLILMVVIGAVAI